MMPREIFNLKYKILMRKPRMQVASKKRKIVNLGGDEKKIQAIDNEVYEDIQNLQPRGM